MSLSRCRNTNPGPATNPAIIGGDPNGGKYGYIGTIPTVDAIDIVAYALLRSLQRILAATAKDGVPAHQFPDPVGNPAWSSTDPWATAGATGLWMVVYDDGTCVFGDANDPPDNIEVYE